MTGPGRAAASLMIAWALALSAPLWAVDTPEAEFLITGLFINDEEQQGADIYRVDERYWLPLDHLSKWTNIQISTVEDQTAISTPLGNSLIAPDSLRHIDGLLHLEMSALKNLGIHARFDQQAYALVLYAPWIGIKPQTAALASSPQEPDYRPPEAGVARLYSRFDGAYSQQQQTGVLYNDALGYLANGAWGLQTTVDDQQNAELGQLYWHTFNRYAALRLGTSKANPGPLLSAPDYTGLQFGFSNFSVYGHLAATTSVNRQMFIDDATYSHDISGSGPKGGIAELRLNGRPIARVRIALDGRFLFKRLPVTQGNIDRVEVALFEYSLAAPPLEILDYSIASKPRAVSTGEWMFNGGTGKQGSSLENAAEGESTSYGSLRYGLSNFLTLEAATLQQEGSDSGWYTGIITSIGPHLSASIGKANTESLENYGAELAANWPSLSANFRGNRETEKENSSLTESQDLSARWKLKKNLSLIARGQRKTKAEETEKEYLAAGFDWGISRHASLSVLPTGDEQYDTRLSLRSMDYDANVQLRATNDSHGIGINYAMSNALSLSWDYSEHSDQLRAISAAATYRPRHNNDSVYSAQISQQAQQLGYSLGWRHRLSPRTQFNLSYYRNLEDESVLLEELQITDSESLAISIESELWFSRRGWRHNGAKTDSTHGAISARVLGADGAPLNSQDIKLQIEGASSTLKPGENGEQTLAGLAPGDYNLKLLTEGLPIEYESNSSNFRVKVAAAATTTVEITLKAHFGVAGQLTHNGKPQPYTWISVWRDGESVADGKTDGYGYYQIAGLLPGGYELHYEDVRSHFEIVDEYLFDIDMASGTAPPPTSALLGPVAADEAEHPLDTADADPVDYVIALLDTLGDATADPDPASHSAAAPKAPDLTAGLIDLSSVLPSGLSGRVYYGREPLGHVTVLLKSQGRKIATVFTDSYGYYSFHHLSEGDYEVSAGDSVMTYTVAKTRTYEADIHLTENSVSATGKTIWMAR